MLHDRSQQRHACYLSSPVSKMWDHRGSTTNAWGLDATGLIEYRFNQQGFRGCRDFDFVPKHVFFGCSIVFGIGVPQDQIFAARFVDSHNYGLAGNYTNQDIVGTILDFQQTALYQPPMPMAVIWSDRDQKQLADLLHEIRHMELLHFFCGDIISPGPLRYKLPTNRDHDVSNTHAGPRTHDLIYKTLCSLFKP